MEGTRGEEKGRTLPLRTPPTLQRGDQSPFDGEKNRGTDGGRGEGAQDSWVKPFAGLTGGTAAGIKYRIWQRDKGV